MNKCSKCKKTFQDDEFIWEFGDYPQFLEYKDKEYCKECFDKLYAKYEKKLDNSKEVCYTDDTTIK